MQVSLSWKQNYVSHTHVHCLQQHMFLDFLFYSIFQKVLFLITGHFAFCTFNTLTIFSRLNWEGFLIRESTTLQSYVWIGGIKINELKTCVELTRNYPIISS